MLETAEDLTDAQIWRYAHRAVHLAVQLMTLAGPDAEPHPPWPEVTPVQELVDAVRWALMHWIGDPGGAVEVHRRDGVASAAYWRESPAATRPAPAEVFTAEQTYDSDLAGRPVLDLLHELYRLLHHRWHIPGPEVDQR